MSRQSAIRAVIFDWAGTTVDFGSLAPVMAFSAVFEDAGVHVSTEEIRRLMGFDKRQHLAGLLRDDRVAGRWRAKHGSDPTERDVARLFDALNQRLVSILPEYADPIPGASGVVSTLRAAGMRIGSNSGYTAPMMDVLTRAARQRGFEPDCVVSASDVRAGRPAPDMSLECLKRLGLGADATAIKVDDTRAGIEEGRAAGLWTVAVTDSGNEIGLSLAQWQALTTSEQTRLRDGARRSLQGTKPDYIINTVANVPEVIELIERRIRAGEQPALR